MTIVINYLVEKEPGGSMGGGMSPGPPATYILFSRSLSYFYKNDSNGHFISWKLIFSLVSTALLSKVKGDMIFGIMTRKIRMVIVKLGSLEH